MESTGKGRAIAPPWSGEWLALVWSSVLRSSQLSNLVMLLLLGAAWRCCLPSPPTALVGSGFDLCRVDGALASADVVGRLRIFELDREQRYRFAWGLSMYAPRRVAFSPDCTHIAVTSGDDRHVLIIDRTSRQVVATHNAGPALREVMATRPREFSITDICGVTSYAW